MDRQRIYVARKISGSSGEDVMKWYDVIRVELREMGFDVLSPMTGKEEFRNEVKYKAHGYDGSPVVTNHAIFERDKWMVQNCDVVLMDLSMCDSVSIGCMMELAWASLLGKHTIAVIPEGNIHQHAFVLEAADTVYDSLDKALLYLHRLGGAQ